MATPYSAYGWNFFTVLLNNSGDLHWPVFDPSQAAPSGHGGTFTGVAAPSNAITGPETLVLLRGFTSMATNGGTFEVMRGAGFLPYFDGGFLQVQDAARPGGAWEVPLWDGLCIETQAVGGRVIFWYELPNG